MLRSSRILCFRGQLWDVFKHRFPGVDYGAIISAETSDKQTTLWKKRENQASEVTARKLADPHR